IDVGDNAEIARVLDTHEARQLCGRSESSTRVAQEIFRARGVPLRVAHASRVLASASARSRTSPVRQWHWKRMNFKERLFRRDAGAPPGHDSEPPRVGNRHSHSYNRTKCQS